MKTVAFCSNKQDREKYVFNRKERKQNFKRCKESSRQLPPVYMLGMTFCGMEYPFGQPRSLVPAVVPPSFFCTPSHWQSMRHTHRKSPLLRINTV